MESINFIDLWKVAISISGLGAVACLVFLSLYKKWLTLGIFSQLTKQQTFSLMRLFLVLTFLFSTFALVVYLLSGTSKNDERSEVEKNLSRLQMNEAVNKACILFESDSDVPVMLPATYMDRLFGQFHQDAITPYFQIRTIRGFAHRASDFQHVSHQYARTISMNRAYAVANLLVSQLGVDRASIRLEGRGLDPDAEMIGPYLCGAKLYS